MDYNAQVHKNGTFILEMDSMLHGYHMYKNLA